MKMKDLPKGIHLGGIKVRTPTGQEGYWASQWLKGVWLSHNADLNGRITPVFVEDLRETLEWEVIDERFVKLTEK